MGGEMKSNLIRVGTQDKKEREGGHFDRRNLKGKEKTY